MASGGPCLREYMCAPCIAVHVLPMLSQHRRSMEVYTCIYGAGAAVAVVNGTTAECMGSGLCRVANRGCRRPTCYAITKPNVEIGNWSEQRLAMQEGSYIRPKNTRIHTHRRGHTRSLAVARKRDRSSAPAAIVVSFAYGRLCCCCFSPPFVSYVSRAAVADHCFTACVYSSRSARISVYSFSSRRIFSLPVEIEIGYVIEHRLDACSSVDAFHAKRLDRNASETEPIWTLPFCVTPLKPYYVSLEDRLGILLYSILFRKQSIAKSIWYQIWKGITCLITIET